MKYTVEWEKRTVKQLAKIAPREQKRIVLAVSKLASDPRPPGATNLVGRTNHHRIRVGDYRVVYEIHDSRLIIYVVAVTHRRDVYR